MLSLAQKDRRPFRGDRRVKQQFKWHESDS